MIRRLADAFFSPVLEECRRLARLGVDPVVIEIIDGQTFRCRPNVESSMFAYCFSGCDYAGLAASVAWIKEGPKIVNITEEQYQAFSRVEVRLTVEDFQPPYPTILFNMPAGKMHTHVILHRRVIDKTPILIATSSSTGGLNDIVTLVRGSTNEVIETSLGKFGEGVTNEEGTSAHTALRVACNMALAMTNFGCQASYLFPAEVERDRKFATKKGRPDAQRRARERLAEQPLLVTLDRNVTLFHREGGHPDGEATGREMPFHWRRGHWRKSRVGEGRMQTKLIFIPPCMVRADRLTVNPDETTTIYQ